MEPQEPLKTTPPDTQNLNTDDRSLQKSDGSEPEGVYVVEEILGKRVINEQKFYLVHWKNYPDVQSTWEPIENLLNALDLVIEYEVRECLKECNQDSKDTEEDNDPLSQLKFQIPFNFTTENDVFIRLRTSDINPGYIGPMAMQIPRENGVTPMETSPTPKKKKKRMRQDSEHHIEVEPKEEKIKHKLKKVKITSSSNSFGGGKIIKLKRLQTTSLENITISTSEAVKKKRGRPPKSAQKDSSIILSQKSKEQITISVENAKKDGLKGLKGLKGIKKYKKKDKAKSEEKIVDKGPEKAELVIKRPRGRPKLIKPTPSSIEKREVEISPEKSNSVIIPKKRGRPFKIKKDMTSSMEKKGDDETKMLKTDKNKTVVISKSMGDLDSGRSSSTKILLALKPTKKGKSGKSKDKIKMEVSISPEKGGKNVSPEKGPDGQVKRKRGRPPGKKNANKEVEKEKEKEKEKILLVQPVPVTMPMPQKKLMKSLSSSSIELNRDAGKDKSGVTPVLVPKKRGRPPKYLKETSAKGKMEVEEKAEKVKSKMSVSQPKSTARSGMEVESSTDR